MSYRCSPVLLESVDTPILRPSFCQDALWNHTVLAVEKGMTTQHPMAAEVSHKQIFKIIVFLWGFVSQWWSFPLIGWSCWDTESITRGRKNGSQMTSLILHTSFAFVLSSFYLQLPVSSLPMPPPTAICKAGQKTYNRWTNQRWGRKCDKKKNFAICGSKWLTNERKHSKAVSFRGY